MKPITSIHAGGHQDFSTELKKQEQHAVQKAECDPNLSVNEKKDVIKAIIQKFEWLISNSTKNLYLKV